LEETLIMKLRASSESFRGETADDITFRPINSKQSQ
jgi:hypothetical protein